MYIVCSDCKELAVIGVLTGGRFIGGNSTNDEQGQQLAYTFMCDHGPHGVQLIDEHATEKFIEAGYKEIEE